ncbi:MAG: glucan biosynthesis protein [Verrucomicrobia bacterium]|nr:glucan biosynthesis protein [Verrucomicrobiota bacterium]
MKLRLQGVLCFVLGAGFLPLASAADSDATFAAWKDRARRLAAQAPAPPVGEVPAWLRGLTYDQLRRIEFDGRRSLWHGAGLSWEVQFLHPGFLFDRTVRISEQRSGREVPVPFSPSYFNYHGLPSGELPPGMGFAGFRMMFPLQGPGTSFNEVGSFAGASYFRLLCAGAAYGLSARGLALDTAEPVPEEFPLFTEFLLVRPAAGAQELTILALLESASVVGAYRFVVRPGSVTDAEIHAVLYFRQRPRVVGLAPLTSMFWRGENSNVAAEDFRPEVHDSDGLLLHTGSGEWIWRPLANPRQVRAATFQDRSPRGFGLLQRDRNFENYQDLEASYHARPGAWVEPLGDWGPGGVRLVEIPTAAEIDDNIVAFWVPEELPGTGEPLEFRYRLRWFLDGVGPPGGAVRATRRGRSAIYEPGFERFVVDFDGRELQALAAGAVVEPVVTVGTGARLHHATAQKNPINGSWRAAFTLRPDGTGQPVELRCFLRRDGKAMTETWSYLWQP